MDNIHLENEKNLYNKVLANMNFDLKRNIITCGLVPALGHIALTKIAIMLFQYDFRDDADQLFYSNPFTKSNDKRLYELLNLVENNVLAKSSSLNLTWNCKDSLQQKLKVMKDEMEHFFCQYLDLSIHSVRDAKEIILSYYDNLCWTYEGKLNVIKTMVNIIENSNLNTMDKYILACYSCLEDKIQNLLQILPENLINNFIKEDNFKKFRLVTFWTCHFRGKQEKFLELINGEETYEYLLNWTALNEKIISWHYFWKNFSDDSMKARNIYAVEFSEQISLTYFLSQKNHDFEIENPFEMEQVGTYFADTLDRISKSCKIVLVPYYIFNYMETHDVRDSYSVLINSWKYNHINTVEYNKICQKFTLFLNNDNLIDLNKTIHNSLYESIIFSRDWETVNFLLKISTYQNIKDFLYGNSYRFEFSKRLIVQGSYHFDKIIKHLLISEEEIIMYKNFLFSSSGFDDILYELIVNNKFEILKDSSFVFCSTVKINKYKYDLPLKNNASIILKICIDSKDSNLLILLNKFISWCYDENQDEITRCKTIIFDPETNMYDEHKEELIILKN